MMIPVKILMIVQIVGWCADAQITYPCEVFMGQDEDEYKGSGVRLTRPDGTFVYVNPRTVAFVRAPLAGEQGNAVLVFSSGAKQSVREDVEHVIDAIAKDMPGGEQ